MLRSRSEERFRFTCEAARQEEGVLVFLVVPWQSHPGATPFLLAALHFQEEALSEAED